MIENLIILFLIVIISIYTLIYMQNDIAGLILVNSFTAYLFIKYAKRIACQKTDPVIVGNMIEPIEPIENGENGENGENISNNDKKIQDKNEFIKETAPHMYGIDLELYNTFKNYKEPEIVIRNLQDDSYNADSNLIRMGRQRDRRIKLTQENKANLTSDYFKHHFSNELDRNEKREWWGRNEE